MADDGFLKRWSRRKRGAADGAPEPGPPDAAIEAATPAPAEPQIDPATLPSLESLGAESDYTVFLRQGVPEAIRNAALRRAWASDPVIRDFRTPADYDWDFNAPGYGALDPSVDIEKLVDQVFGGNRTAAAEPDAAPPEPAPTVAAIPPAPAATPGTAAATPADIAFTEPPPPRRKRGGALPE